MPFERPALPGNARCVVTLTFDNFGESFDLLRYGHAGGASADGVYAPRRGVERVLDLLDRQAIPATFFVEGWNARKYAGLAREVDERGHEVAGHGWMHERWNELDRETERDLIARTTEALAEATGRRPTGWRAPSGLSTRWTVAALHAAGYGYDSSFGDDDAPYWLQVAADSDAEMIELPWTWTLDDAPYYAHPGTLRRPSRVIDLWIEEFDAAFALTGYFMLVCHPRYAGRPSRILALERLIEHIKSHEGVWFARCDQLAEHAARALTTPHHPAPETLAE
jgi:peptidoglycan/xylan/chitin deacetylase (PgdA/CDA1 family)